MAVLFAEGYWPNSNPAARRKRVQNARSTPGPSRGFFFSLVLALALLRRFGAHSKREVS